MKKERRALDRLIPSRAMQVIFKGDRPIIGRIYNITTKGIAVEYDGSVRPDPDREFSIKLAIDLQSSLVINDVRCKLIYDIPTLARGQTFRGKNMRLCGLRYSQSDQTDQTMLRKLLAAAN